MRPIRPVPARGRGFSLVELMAATAILTLLSLMAVPYAQTAKDREQEVQLLDSLTRLRLAIERYAWNETDGDLTNPVIGDNDGDGVAEEDPAGDPDGDGLLDDDRDGKVDEDGPPNYPQNLQELVTKGYLSSIPPDPFFLDRTQPASNHWRILRLTRESTFTDQTGAPQVITPLSNGIFEVRSKSAARALDGSRYGDW